MILDIKHLRLAYGAHVLAPDVTFHLEGGECVLLAGANGCGKSTLLRTLACEGMYAETASLRPSQCATRLPARLWAPPIHVAMGGHRFRHTHLLRLNVFLSLREFLR